MREMRFEMGEKNWLDVAILVVLLAVFVFGLFGVIGLRNNLAKAPTLSVALDDTTVTSADSIEVKGTATPGAKVQINGKDVQTDKSGNFSATETVNAGSNKMEVVAKNGNKTTTVDKQVVKEESDQSVAGATDGGQNTGNKPSGGQNGQNLNQSGPVENIWGIFGLTSIFVSLFYYFERRKFLVASSK